MSGLLLLEVLIEHGRGCIDLRELCSRRSECRELREDVSRRGHK